MADAPEQEHRIARLRDLLNHPDFGGIKARLGRALGYKEGAFVRQMLDGERPISEKTVRQIETMQGGKFRGWFSPPPGMCPLTAELIQLFEPLPLEQKRVIFATATAFHNAKGEPVKDDHDPIDGPVSPPTPQQDKAR